MHLSELLKIGTNILKEKKISSYQLDAELMLAKIVNKSREKILIDQNASKTRK